MRTVTSKHVSPLAITGWIAATLLAAALFTAPAFAFADEDAQPSIDDTAAMSSEGESAAPEEGTDAEEPAVGDEATASDTAPATATPGTSAALTEGEVHVATLLEDESAEASADETATADETAPAEDPEATTGADATSYQNMYRLYNPHTGEHFYTADFDEAMAVAEAGWQYEGVGWVAPVSSGAPVYRLYNGFAGDHHYTLSEEERDALVAEGWAFEGIGWYSDESESALAVLRQYNPNAEAGAHNFTLSAEENAQLVAAGWDYEGVAWYAADQAALPIEGRWLVTSAWGTLERYWLGTDAQIAKSRLVDPSTELDADAGWTAYATPTGAVVRGAWDDGAGHVYLADGDGRLELSSGWLVTDKYAGSLQRYWMDGEAHAAVSGLFEVDGNHYYGVEGQGYVLRGKLRHGEGMLLADNDGVLAWEEGWLITGAYDGGELQRYRIDASPGDGLMGARLGEFTVDGSRYYGTYDQGYVARNCVIYTGSEWCQADNDGVLTSVAIWKYPSGGEYPNLGSVSNLNIEVSIDAQRVYVKSGSEVIYTMICSTGVNDSTPRGTFYVQNRGTTFYNASEGMGANWWVSWLYWGTYLFHTVPIDGNGNYIVSEAEKLGQPASHGCIRLTIPDAKWLYDQLPQGTTVYIH